MAITYSLSGLPQGSGLSFNASTRTLSGTPNAADRAASPMAMVYTADDGNDNTATLNFTITVNAQLVAPSFSDPTGDAQTWTQNRAIAPITVPAASGNPTPIYAAVGSLPSGLSFNTSTRVISGTPTAAGSGTITIRATNSVNTADWTVAYTISPEPVGTITYSLSGLPQGSGLSFNASTRTLSGTPNAADRAASPMAMVYTADAGSGNIVILAFSITVNLTPSPSNPLGINTGITISWDGVEETDVTSRILGRIRTRSGHPLRKRPRDRISAGLLRVSLRYPTGQAPVVRPGNKNVVVKLYIGGHTAWHGFLGDATGKSIAPGLHSLNVEAFGWWASVTGKVTETTQVLSGNLASHLASTSPTHLPITVDGTLATGPANYVIQPEDQVSDVVEELVTYDGGLLFEKAGSKGLTLQTLGGRQATGSPVLTLSRGRIQKQSLGRDLASVTNVVKGSYGGFTEVSQVETGPSPFILRTSYLSASDLQTHIITSPLNEWTHGGDDIIGSPRTSSHSYTAPMSAIGYSGIYISLAESYRGTSPYNVTVNGVPTTVIPRSSAYIVSESYTIDGVTLDLTLVINVRLRYQFFKSARNEYHSSYQSLPEYASVQQIRGGERITTSIISTYSTSASRTSILVPNQRSIDLYEERDVSGGQTQWETQAEFTAWAASTLALAADPREQGYLEYLPTEAEIPLLVPGNRIVVPRPEGGSLSAYINEVSYDIRTAGDVRARLGVVAQKPWNGVD